jgi:hypothetical protein
MSGICDDMADERLLDFGIESEFAKLDQQKRLIDNLTIEEEE